MSLMLRSADLGVLALLWWHQSFGIDWLLRLLWRLLFPEFGLCELHQLR